ncbi:MAG: hypothetical protein D6689_18235 [Deltaproteobacteria bacterium]|nr:MAG: hypothetical protein D6689_18235 [Deltaproteobacteria bacterium]
MVRAAVFLGVAAAVSGCARRPVPYRFRAPLVDGVAAAPVAPRPQRAEFATSRAITPPVPLAPETRRRRAPRAPTGPVSPARAALYALVGTRAGGDPARFAVAALERLGLRLAPEVAAAADGPALVAAARARGALFRRGPVALGDLVVFDGLQGAGPAALVGVVTASRADGTVEFIYLGMGVVRRGYVHVARPRDRRDRDGRVLNTWLRVRRGHYARGLAGDVFSTYIRLDRLTR